MKICFLLFILILGVFLLGINQPRIEAKLVGLTLKSSANLIKSKYDLIPSGSGVAMPGGPIKELFLAFDTHYILTKHEIRRLLIEINNEVMKEVNNNHQIQAYLLKRLFTIKDIHIVIYNHDQNGKRVYDPEISVGQILQGNISYKTVSKENKLKYKNEYEETYEEAMKLMNDGH